MTSSWMARHSPTTSDAVPDRSDVVIVGGGIAGLVTAVLAARRGLDVCVLEARQLGAGTTGHSSAKVTVLHGTKYSELLERHRSSRVKEYVAANLRALDWLREFMAERNVNTLKRTATTFARNKSELETVKQEFTAAKSLGLDVVWSDDGPEGFPSIGAVMLADQLLIDPMELLDALVSELREAGGKFVQEARVTATDWLGAPSVALADETRVECDFVVVATGLPVLDRGLFFAKVQPQRSYVIDFELRDAPEIMALSASNPTISLRDDQGPDGNTHLQVGGNGHVTGRTQSEAAHVELLRSWVHQNFEGAVETSVWSAQDQRTWDGFPWAGPLPRGNGKIFTLTGFDKWGFTNAVAAAQIVVGHMTGAVRPEAASWSRMPFGVRDAQELLSFNASVARELILRGASPKIGDEPTTRMRCTHLGGPLRWNTQEESWDCPLHGSRFAPDGQVLEGPAVCPLSNFEKE